MARNLLCLVLMPAGLLESTGAARIRIDSQNDILSASATVFEPENQEESRIVIYEADYVAEYLSEFSSLLNLGATKFVQMTEPGRQATVRYNEDGTRDIVLTKAHRSVDRVLEEMGKPGEAAE
ncbi:MAG: hypothetical protein Fur0032_01400 [Terrimicrobiaceae bacterium]